MKSYIFILSLVFILTGCQNDSKVIINNKLPNDVLWVTKSVEYNAICEQIYNMASLSLFEDLHKINEPIIIMDLDETVLDNSYYQIELFAKQAQFEEATWNKWVMQELSQMVPGAKKFIIAYKKYKNARIIYISNRSQSTLASTINNMKDLGVYFENDIFLLRENKSDTKIVRRKEVYEGANRMREYGAYIPLAYFGDAMGDFPNEPNKDLAAEIFIFPNPMYGKWDR